MQKKFLFAVVFLLSSWQVSRAYCAYTPLFETLYRTPLIVYGTVKNIKANGSQTSASLFVETVFKGNLSVKTLEINIFNAGEYASSINENEKRVYFLAENAAKKWEILPGRCTANSLLLNNQNEIVFTNQKSVSFADFKEGLSLLTQNYDALHNYSKQPIANTAKNQTFAFLIGQIQGQQPPVNNVVTAPLPQKEPIKPKRKKRKK
ncbi:MAG: hypothetical protein RI894_1412 [Bacteroidota bacterium]|jgi:hypothetical protein